MSIRNIINPQFKNWMNSNVNELNAKKTIVNAGDEVELDGGLGITNDIIVKDASNDLTWEAKGFFGDNYETGLYVPAPFAYSGTPQLVTASQHTTADLPAGTYYIGYTAQSTLSTSILLTLSNNTTGATYLKIGYDGTISGGIFQDYSGFIIQALSGINVLETTAVSPGGGANNVKNIRYYIYRIF